MMDILTTEIIDLNATELTKEIKKPDPKEIIVIKYIPEEEENKLDDPPIEDLRLEDLFTEQHLLDSALLCFKGTRWKRSVQEVEINAPEICSQLREKVLSCSWRSKGFHIFVFYERGKPRVIKAVHITERIVQRVLCDYYLTPLLTRKFIHENCACIKGKGLDFARERIEKQLRQFYGLYKNDGYALVMDIHDFFGSIDHDILKSKVLPKIKDERISDLLSYLIDLNKKTNLEKGNNEKIGLGLGSHVSQILALEYLDDFDKYVKLTLQISLYFRYNDDFYVLTHTLEEAERFKRIITNRLKTVERLEVSEQKCKIYRLCNGFKILKTRWILKNSGFIETRPLKKVMNQFIRYFSKRIEDKRIPTKQLITDFLNWKNVYKKKFTDLTYLIKIENKFKELLSYDPRTKDIIENDTLKGSDFS